MKKAVLCIDIGSSSVRCSLYELAGETIRPLASDGVPLLAARSWDAVHPTTGHIQWWQNNNDGAEMLDFVDSCIDDVFAKLLSIDVQMVALGFSSLVMNLVGVDAQGQVLPEATMSYACNAPAVAANVKELQT